MLGLRHPVHHFDTWFPLFRAHTHTSVPQPGPQPTRPCRSDVFVSHQASLSRSPSFQRKGFRSQVKQMSGDDRIRARQARNVFARPDTSRATDTADMTRARRRQRSPRGTAAATEREGRDGGTGVEEKRNFNVTSHSNSDQLIGCQTTPPPSRM